jgi:hypothetical protein
MTGQAQHTQSARRNGSEGSIGHAPTALQLLSQYQAYERFHQMNASGGCDWSRGRERLLADRLSTGLRETFKVLRMITFLCPGHNVQDLEGYHLHQIEIIFHPPSHRCIFWPQWGVTFAVGARTA